NNSCIRLQLFNGLDGAGEAASVMDIKRDNCLAGKVILVKETVYRHGEVSPPVGITDENGIILIQIINMGGQFRSGMFVLFFRSIINQFSASRGIDNGSVDGEQISSHIFLNHICHSANPAYGLPVDGSIAGRGNSIDTAVF